ncbi:MAG: mannosylglycerate synthase domain-containing protein [Actinomycetota bacterium]
MPDAPSSLDQGTMVVIPFDAEDHELVATNLTLAASHPAVSQVIGVAAGDDPTWPAVAERIEARPTISIKPQQRCGALRPGKGDAINTGFRLFLESDLRRLHFYDADIRSFNTDWIARAEKALDRGYQAVRHYYPRAATDGMITWMITRPAFAMLWPQSVLPWIEQPLSGELAFARDSVERLASDQMVIEQSDWGIDTVITYATAAHGLSIYETYASEGKDHALYESLLDLKTMALECLGALQRLRTAVPPSTVVHVTEPATAAAYHQITGDRIAGDRITGDRISGDRITGALGFDIELTQRLLSRTWTRRQEVLLRSSFESSLADAAIQWQEWPDTSAMDEHRWLVALRQLLDLFDPTDSDWRELAFRLWVGRVLHYTTRVAVRGYGPASEYLHGMMRRTIAGSSGTIGDIR